MTVDVITATIFKSELKELLIAETELSDLLIHCICLLGVEVLNRKEFFVAMNFREDG